MTNSTKIFLFLLRVSLGCMFLYAGLSKLLTPGWSAAGYLNTAQSFPWFYHWLSAPTQIGFISALNEWSLLLLGISLILGLFVRVSTALGTLLMLLYYFPILNFPLVGKNYFLVDDHIIFIVCLLLLNTVRAGRYWGLDAWCARLPICERNPKLRAWLG